jgi:hypothetical protein
LTGCAQYATRYTWTGNEGMLPEVNLECSRDISKSYVPRIAAARAELSTGILVGGVIPTLYKDCLEKNGYLKTGTDRVLLVWDEALWRWRPEPTCGAADQTCLWVTPEGWGIAPLPQDGHRPKP